MWANGDQPNAQWWPMQYGYQYSNPNQDASADWATRAAVWAQQRQAQEVMAKQHQQYYATMQSQPPPDNNIPSERPPLPNSDGTDRLFLQNSSDPPLPPGESEIAPPKPNHGADNMETVAMEDESLDTNLQEQEVAVTRLDYNHGQPVPLPEVAPPPIPGMQTFDHNHGFTPAAGAPAPAYVPAQRFDYGHQSANYEHQKASHPPPSQWYDYNHMHSAEQQHYETDRHHSRHSSNRSELPQSHIPAMLDYGSMSEIKKKALPLWIREGLEKMEREKEKKQKQEIKKSLNSSTSSLSNISGYDHGNIQSPVLSPEKPQSDEEPDSSDNEEGDIKKDLKKKENTPHQSGKHSILKRSPSLSPQKSASSSDDEVDYRNDSEKQQDLLLRMRKMLTEVLLSVTNDELHNVAKEAYNEALLDENRQLRSSGGLDVLRQGGTLGLGDYGSNSESESEEEPEIKTTEQRHHPVYEKEDYKQNTRHSRSRTPRKENSNESDGNRSQSGSPVSNRKQRKSSSSMLSDEDESDISGSASHKKKKRRSKHRRRQRSLSYSPKRRPKHKHRRTSRSRSRTPKKRKSSKRDRSDSPSASRSARKSKRHSRSLSRTPSDRRHSKNSRSRSRSPRSRKKRSRSRSPRRRRDRQSTSSDRYREGKRGSERRSRSRSRSSTPRHKRH